MTVNTDGLAEEIFAVTQSAADTQLRKQRYLAALRYSLAQSEQNRYKKPWTVSKSNGGERQIVNAGEILGIVQYYLGRFFSSIKQSELSYYSVFEAVSKHRISGKRMALVYDLKDAYNSTTREMVFKALKRKLWWRNGISDRALNAIADLVTYKGYVPVGCSSSKHIFNLAAEPIDAFYGNFANGFENAVLTRYEDDYCLSFGFDWKVAVVFPFLKQFVHSIARRHGYGISRIKTYSQQPFSYLGTRIFQDKLEVDSGKIDEYKAFMEMVLDHPRPREFRDTVTGMDSWVIQIAGEDMPDELFKLFYRYYAKIRHQPPGFSEIVDKRGHIMRF